MRLRFRRVVASSWTIVRTIQWFQHYRSFITRFLTTMVNYRYRPLSSSHAIRIVTVFPGTKASPIQCSIFERADESYEALSWCWGDEDESETLELREPHGEKRATGERMLIKPNLAKALRCLRSETEPRNFWVDALCIDQTNKVERADQVKIMRLIYHDAQRVCVWLSEEDFNTRRALAFIKEHISDLGAFDQAVQDQIKADDWYAFGALLTKPWFSRRWIIQEIAYARAATVHCGDKYVGWHEFETAVALFERDAPKVSTSFKGLSKFNHNAHLFGDIPALEACRLVHILSNVFGKSDAGIVLHHFLSLEELISSLSAFEAREPYDVFYAVLSLAKDVIGQLKASDVVSRPDSKELQEPAMPARAPVLTASGRTIEPEDHEDHERAQKKPRLGIAPIYPADTFQEPVTRPWFVVPPIVTADDVDSNAFARPKSPSNSALMNTTASSELWRSVVGLSVLRAVRKFRSAGRKEEKRIFDVDYDQPFIDVCKQFLAFVIPRSGSLDIICRPWAPFVPGEKFPSWLPMLSRTAFAPRRANVMAGQYTMNRRNPDPLVGQANLTHRVYSAWPGQNIVQDQDWGFGEPRPSGPTLFVSGFVLDTIGQSTESSQHGNIPESWLQLGRWQAARGRNQKLGPPPDDFWRTLVGGRSMNGSNPPIYWRSACEYAFNQSSDGDGMQTSNIIEHGSSSVTTEFLRRVQSVIWNRKLFRTAHDRFLGLAPKEAQNGDCEHARTILWSGSC